MLSCIFLKPPAQSGTYSNYCNRIVKMVIRAKDMSLQLTAIYSVLPAAIITFTMSNSTHFIRSSNLRSVAQFEERINFFF